MSSDDLTALAADAYVYGFPLVFDLREVSRFTRAGLGSLPAQPFNSFSHASALAGPPDQFVSVNNDTIYSIAQIDLSGGPLRLDVPDTAGRYYVLQFVDAWTNNFAYVGRRASGTAAGRYLLTPPGWKADPADELTVIEFPTMVGSIVGRWACGGPDDLAVISELQAATVLTPDGQQTEAAGIPAPVAVPAELAFYEQLRAWMQAFPPSDADRAYQQRFAPLGLLDETTPYPECAPELVTALTDGAAAGKQKLESSITGGQLPVLNGWRLTYHMFDYNVDHLGPGTIDDPKWMISDRPDGYLARALAARAGLWGNHGYEAAYPLTYVDADNDQLDGRIAYTITFSPLPPVDAFWSLTMYDLPDFYLVDNPIGRYSVGDRTEGLRYDSDGGLTIVIQHQQPADTSNWLPAPAAPFRPILRLYQPQPAVLDGTYQVPPIRKAGR
ncbi:MAG TPA: DUF1254 domain-containing protein [Streptosporangiaceae bacterium]